MSRLQVIYNPDEFLGLRCYWLTHWVEHYLEFVPYEPNRTYNSSAAVCATWQTALQGSPWYLHLLESGHKLIIEHLWDSDVDLRSNTQEVPGALMLRNPNWIWYCDSQRWREYKLLDYVPAPAVTHSFFMPMYKQRWHRDRIPLELGPELTTALWSYASSGRVLLPEPPPQIEWVHHFDSSWYDSTSFSVAVESYMHTDSWTPESSVLRRDQRPRYRTEVSEKIFKPMLGQHPFMVFGSVDTLAYLHREGFETWDHLWSERYDAIVGDSARFDAVTQLVRSTVARWVAGERFRDPLTLEKIAHNHARLCDSQLVAQRFRNEIIADILNFAQ